MQNHNTEYSYYQDFLSIKEKSKKKNMCFHSYYMKDRNIGSIVMFDNNSFFEPKSVGIEIPIDSLYIKFANLEFGKLKFDIIEARYSSFRFLKKRFNFSLFNF